MSQFAAVKFFVDVLFAEDGLWDHRVLAVIPAYSYELELISERLVVFLNGYD